MSSPRNSTAALLEALRIVEESGPKLREMVAAQLKREQDIAQRMYRRGYLAGRASARRGDPAVTNPERRARGELKELLR